MQQAIKTENTSRDTAASTKGTTAAAGRTTAIPGITIDFTTLHQVQQNVSASARHGKALLQQVGQFFSQYKGRGMDFAEVRAYQAGDDIRSIDWRVTARTGKAHTKLYHEERERPIWIAVDQSHSQFFGTKNCFKSVQACLIGAQLAWQAQQLGDRIGSLVFSEQSQHHHLPCTGKKGLQALFQFMVDYNQMLALSPQGSTTHPETSNPKPLEHALKSLLEYAAPGSFVVLISDFADFDSNIRTQLQQLAHKTHLLSYYVFDPIEADLPTPQSKKRQAYYIGEGDQQLKLNLQDKKFHDTLANDFTRQFEAVKTCIQNAGGHFMSCSTEEALLPVMRKVNP